MKYNKTSQSWKFAISALCISGSIVSLTAKNKAGVIMTVDGADVPSEEFVYLFQKNNQQQTQPQSLDEYLDLFEIYRLKVAEAISQSVDTAESFKKEMALYRRELLEPYITDTVLLNKLYADAASRENTLVESSHIMIIRTNDPEKDKKNLELLDSLHKELLNGADFIEMAKMYSQDRFSSDKGGYLGFNPAGTFPYGFETAVYETPEGGISDIVESHVGWHIVKSGARKPSLDFNRPVKSYDDVKTDVMKKITSPFDPRYHLIRKNLISSLKSKHPDVDTVGFAEEDAYNALIAAEEKYQYANNPEYRNLVDEYTNGSLLYEVSVENVWNKASNDNEGLQSYFKAHKDNYKWDSPHAKGLLIKVVNDSVKNLVKNEISNLPKDSVISYLKKNFRKETSVEKFNVAKGANPMIDYAMFGGEEASPNQKNFETFFVFDGRIVEQPEELDDVKGAVINDYQLFLEQEWIKKLKLKHTVEINKKELGKLRKQLKETK